MYNLSNFEYLKNLGSHAEFIINSYSTVTFPNHWTIVTGLYEESHGIIQNNMYDPKLNKTFNYVSPESQTIEWYGQNKYAEPIWATNQRAGGGRLSAAEWVGSNVVFNNQSIIHIPYNKTKPYEVLIDEFVDLFTHPTDPINFGAVYFDEPDHTGHLYGPYSIEMKNKLFELNDKLGYMINKLKTNDLFDKLNVIITSDHGMESISYETSIFLESHIDTSLFDAYGSRACYSIFVKKVSDIEYVYRTLKTIPHVDVYKKNEVPQELRYKNNVRVGDIVLATHIGYAVYSKNISINFSINLGDHGYDNKASSMHPIFIANGPAFKKHYKIRSFNNVDIYPLMCLILGIEPALHNGTLDNVLDMVNYGRIAVGFNYLFLLLCIVPIGLVSYTSLLLCCRAKKSSIKNENYSTTNNSHTVVDIYNNETQNSNSRLYHKNLLYNYNRIN